MSHTERFDHEIVDAFRRELAEELPRPESC